MTITMPEEKRIPDASESPAGNKTWKVKPRIASVLTRIAALRGIEKQEVLDHYLAQFEHDLLELLAKTQAEMSKSRKRPG